ncbi:copper-translocating P-type ATPase [Cardiobacteriaceae bacterium TAE3-ERU3]|nr:copper-translocating P-type ATPase [Cardiobacteriaceae bacterium TAE3-ERU3]
MSEQSKVVVPLSGLSCGGCVRKLSEALQALDGVEQVQVDKQHASVSGAVSREAVVEVVESLGYEVPDVPPVLLNLSGLSCGKCVAKVKAALDARDDVFAHEVNKTRLQARTTATADELIALIESLGYEATVASDADAQPVACEVNVSETAQTGQHQADDELHQFILEGMTCASCVSSVEQAIAALDGVSEVRVNLAERTAAVWGSVAPASVEQAVKDAGYSAQLQDDAETRRAELADNQAAQYQRFRRDAWIALAVGAPLMLWGVLGGSMAVDSTTSRITWGVVALITLALLATVGRHYFVGAWQSIKHRRATMDTLVALGTGAAWLYSTAVVLMPSAFPDSARHVYFEATAMILGLITLGHAIETRARAKTSAALDRLLDLQPQTALVVIDGKEQTVPLADVTTGMTLRLKPGAKVAVDGEVSDGDSYVDESMLTGEPLAVHKAVGDTLHAGTVNQSGTLLYRATQVGKDTMLARIITLVRQAQTSKPALARLADRIAAVFVPVVVGIAVLTALLWYAFGPEPKISYMLITAVTVLIIACPCALGLATPLSVTIGVGRAAELGVLVRDAEALQLGAAVDTVVLDKTGTLTEGKPRLTTVHPVYGDEAALLATAAALEQSSEHPLAQAILAAHDQAIQPLQDFQSLGGKGVQGVLDDSPVALGNAAMMVAVGVDVREHDDTVQTMAEQGETPVYVACDGQLIGILGISDPLREDSAQAIKALHDLGLRVVMLTGDVQATADAIAAKVGIDEVVAGVLPDGKAEVVQRLQKEGRRVAMVGDGINDAPALAQADVGMAMGGGTDVAIESAAFTLMRHSVISVVDALALSRATLRNMKGNLLGAFIYNAVGIPIAAGILYPFTGALLSPVIAGGAMALSSITVVSNANRLRLFRSPLRGQSGNGTRASAAQ